MYSKVLNQEFQNEEYVNSSTKRYKINSHGNEPSYQKPKYNSKIIVTSKYIKNPKLTSSMKKGLQYNKEVLNKSNNIANLFSFYKSNKKEQKDLYKTFSHQNEHSSSNLNPVLQKYGPRDGVLRGYTNNCSFYVSGSFDLKQKHVINNHVNNHINNYQRVNYKTNRSNYISDSYKTRSVLSTTPDSYRRRDILKEIKIPFNPKNEKLYSKNSYNSNSNNNNSNRISYYTIKNNQKNKVEKMNYKGYKFPIIQKEVIDKIKEKKLSPVNNQRNFYFSTESINNLKKYNQGNKSNRQKLFPLNHNKTKDKKDTITYISNNNGIKIYKASTNTNVEEKNKSNIFNYFKKIEEKKSNDLKRTHTPNLIRIEIKHKNSKNNKNGIINNYYRYKNELEENKTEKFYKSNNKYHHYKINSGNFKNMNRYNFPENTRLREYETKTEIYSFSSGKKYNKEGISLNYADKTNHFANNKSIDKKEYETSYKNHNNQYARSGRQYGLKTEIQKNERNRSQDIEYEIADISLYRKRNQNNKSTDKININIKELTKAYINNKKEYTSFEKSFRNIRDNEREIKKDKNFEILRGDNSRNHTVFESTNFSKPKKVYKTSTQIQSNRSNDYSLKDEDENNKNCTKIYKYQKIVQNLNQHSDKKYKNDNKTNKSNDINKNNYYYVMKKLEEEFEVDDEQVEYISLEQLHKKNQKQKMKNINNYELTTKIKQENINNPEKEDNSKERNRIDYYQPSQTNNSIYYKSLKKKNPNKKKIVIFDKAQNENEEQNKKQNLPSEKPQIQQNQNNFPNPKNKENEQFEYQETHQQISFIDEYDIKTSSNESKKIQKENQSYEHQQNNEINENNANNVLKKSKYTSYFGDSNNNYYEIKSPSINKNKEEEEQIEEEEENESSKEKNMHYEKQDMQFVRNDNFGIQSENLYVPAEEDKDEKEADEQIFEEDEQAYINNEEKNENDGNEMEKIDEETENENIHENDEESEDNEREKSKQNKSEEENIIEEKNEDEENENDE